MESEEAKSEQKEKAKKVNSSELITLLIIGVCSFLAGLASFLINLGLDISSKIVSKNLFGAGIGILVSLFVGILLFKVPPPVSLWLCKLRIRRLLHELGKQFKNIDMVDKAKLQILLMSILANEQEFGPQRNSVEGYIDIQVAGSFFAQKEIFTTYTAEIEAWNRVCIYLERFTKTVKELERLEKVRYVVRPLAEILECLKRPYKYEIFFDTIENMKSKLWLVPEEVLENRGCGKVEDFILYDDKILVTGSNGITDPDLTKDTKVKVSIIVDPECRHKYLGYKSKLKELEEDKEKFELYFESGGDSKETIQNLRNAAEEKLSMLRKIGDNLLFSIDIKFQNDLDAENISDELRQEFQNEDISLSDSSKIKIVEKGSMWWIRDKNKKYYIVRKENSNLSIWSI